MKKEVSLAVVSTVWRHWKPTFNANGWGVFFTFLFYSLSAYLDLMLKPTQWKVAFDALAVGGDPWPAFRAIIWLMAMAWIMSRIGEFIITRTESNIIKQLRDYTLNGLLRKSAQFFTTHSSGALVAKAKRFANSSEAVIDQLVFSIIRSALLAVYVVIYSAFVIPDIALIFFIWIVLYLAVTISLSMYRMKYDLVSSNADSKTTGYLSDILLSIFTLRVFARIPQEYESFTGITEHERSCRKKAWSIGNIQWGTQHVLMVMLEIFCMYYTIRLVQNGTETIGTAVMVQSYIVSLAMNMWNFGQSWVRIRVAFADAYEMANLLDHPNSEPVTVTENTKSIADNSIIFDNVNFSYLDGHPIIRDFSFHFKAGKQYGLIGPTGSGKTTLIKIMLRLYNNESGTIAVGGNYHTDLDQHTLRSWISFVPQLPTFPSRTVREIVALGKVSATEADITEALKCASCDFVWNLPHGLDTEIGERGVKLSGGECQRLAIAAAILKDAPYVVMDEPTSALDAGTEHAIQTAIKTHFKDKTLIVIAHRLSTVAILDEIIFMKDGKIVASAPHAELLETSTDYNYLWDLQTNPQIVH